LEFEDTNNGVRGVEGYGIDVAFHDMAFVAPRKTLRLRVGFICEPVRGQHGITTNAFHLPLRKARS